MNRKLMAMMENDFCIQELTLYLDTHPHDKAALNMLNQLNRRRVMIKNAVEKEVGPLTNYAQNGYTWDWIKNPWPWDKED